MKDEILVKAEHVSKKFCKSLKRSLYYGVVDTAREFFGMSRSEALRKDEFWAVKDISFTLRRGECLGIIGHNGAGKSTLLKMLNGLIRPDGGRIEMRGRIGALIELGAGFNPILTGRENIYNNAAVLGFTREETDRKIEDIIAFSEIREFIDMPVQNYSSGMKVRLGFAVAAQMEPDILIIDEVLAVGDLGFVLKCLNKIDVLLPKTAVLFVSHSMPMISRICTQLLLLKSGKLLYFGNNVSIGIDKYYSQFTLNNFTSNKNDKVELVELSVSSDGIGFYNSEATINSGSPIFIKLKVFINIKYDYPGIGVIINDKESRGVATYYINRTDCEIKNKTGFIDLIVKFENLPLSKGIYSITLSVNEQNNRNPIFRILSGASFLVSSENSIWTPLELTGEIVELKF
jgi:homopolymeric O-antigen transport system ATP-binding protein